MRSFLIVWLIAFGLVAVAATGVSRLVGSVPPPTPTRVTRSPADEIAESLAAGPFTETDAVEVVARHIPAGSEGDQLRRDLASATVTYHSAQHWRVCYDNACWVAHGPGRYAEPENDAARQREARAAQPRAAQPR
ncbi:MAG: hypothetical protein U0893_17415 [Chloroflexota bacterium]